MRPFSFAAAGAATVTLAIVFMSPSAASSASLGVVGDRNPIEMQASTGPLRGTMNHPEYPGCKVVSLGNGRFMRWNGVPVGVGGNCPSSFRVGSYDGRSRNSMSISGMQCTWSSDSPGSGFCR